MIALTIAAFRFHMISLWLFLPGIGLLIFCSYIFYHNLYPVFNWNKTTGTIIGHELRLEDSDEGQKTYAYEKATFTDHHGKTVEVTSRTSAGSTSDTFDLEVSGDVTIYYDPKNASNAVIFLWRDLLPLLFAPFGVLLIYIGWPFEKIKQTLYQK